MKIITMYNNKGGVGKTTSVINIAYSLAITGNKVLVMDFDEQKNSSRFFLEDDDERGYAPTRYDNISVMTYDECAKRFENIQIEDWVQLLKENENYENTETMA